jgi:hypothetical protein
VRRAQLGERRLEHGLGPVAERAFERAARALHRLLQRPEGAGGEQVVAGTGQHARPAGRGRAERLDEARLPDARLAGDGGNPARPAQRRVESRVQRRQRRAALQQLHGSMLATKGGLPG